MRFTRSTRGAVRFDDMQFDVRAIAEDVERLEEGDWMTLNNGVSLSSMSGKGGAP